MVPYLRRCSQKVQRSAWRRRRTGVYAVWGGCGVEMGGGLVEGCGRGFRGGEMCQDGRGWVWWYCVGCAGR